jgi:hypothetical protein
MTLRRSSKPSVVTLPDGRSVTAESLLRAGAEAAADALLRVLGDPADAEPRTCTCAACGLPTPLTRT